MMAKHIAIMVAGILITAIAGMAVYLAPIHANHTQTHKTVTVSEASHAPSITPLGILELYFSGFR